MEYIIKYSTYVSLETPKGRKRDRVCAEGREEVLEEIMAEIFPNLGKKYKLIELVGPLNDIVI